MKTTTGFARIMQRRLLRSDALDLLDRHADARDSLAGLPRGDANESEAVRTHRAIALDDCHDTALALVELLLEHPDCAPDPVPHAVPGGESGGADPVGTGTDLTALDAQLGPDLVAELYHLDRLRRRLQACFDDPGRAAPTDPATGLAVHRRLADLQAACLEAERSIASTLLRLRRRADPVAGPGP